MELLVEFTLGGACVHGNNPYTILLILSTLALLLPSLLYSHITGTPLYPMYMIHSDSKLVSNFYAISFLFWWHFIYVHSLPCYS